MEKAMAPHSSTLAWRIPWTKEPGRLQSMGSWIIRHDWATSLSLFTFMHWRRQWQPTPVFLPRESQGWGSPVGCCLWGRTESDTTEATWAAAAAEKAMANHFTIQAMDLANYGCWDTHTALPTETKLFLKGCYQKERERKKKHMR